MVDTSAACSESRSPVRVRRVATYVGRVGALAVALGVGIAVTGSPGAACADTSTTSPSPDSPHTR